MKTKEKSFIEKSSKSYQIRRVNNPQRSYNKNICFSVDFRMFDSYQNLKSLSELEFHDNE